MTDWYARRNELLPGMVFSTDYGRVKLDRRVPGDGTDWYVADWDRESWFYLDSRMHPSDLRERLDGHESN